MKRALELVQQWDQNQPFSYEATVDIAEAMAREIVKMADEKKGEILSVNFQVDHAKISAVNTAIKYLVKDNKMKTPRKHAELIHQLADDDSIEIEYYNESLGKWCDVWAAYKILEMPSFEYRIKPTKPSIDWSHLGDEFVQIAIDQNGQSFAFTSGQLIALEDYWKCTDTTKFASLEGFKSFKPGTCDWKDSLVQRPSEGEK